MEDENFSSPQEEAIYWKEKYEEVFEKYEICMQELEENRILSQEMEHELETQLDQSEKSNKELRITNEKLLREIDKLKNQTDSSHLNKEITDLQADYNRVKLEKEDLKKYIRELEQINDDLERTKRVTYVSLEDFEQKLNQAIERNAILESELDEKDALQILVQRLKDETRDLRQELDVRNHSREKTDPQYKSISQQTSLTENVCDVIDSNRLNESLTGLINISQRESALNGNGMLLSPMRTGQNFCYAANSPLNPSIRISALNLVGDLLRKVNALESKLAACRPPIESCNTLPNASRRVNGLTSSNSMTGVLSSTPVSTRVKSFPRENTQPISS